MMRLPSADTNGSLAERARVRRRSRSARLHIPPAAGVGMQIFRPGTRGRSAQAAQLDSWTTATGTSRSTARGALARRRESCHTWAHGESHAWARTPRDPTATAAACHVATACHWQARPLQRRTKDNSQCFAHRNDPHPYIFFSKLILSCIGISGQDVLSRIHVFRLD